MGRVTPTQDRILVSTGCVTAIANARRICKNEYESRLLLTGGSEGVKQAENIRHNPCERNWALRGMKY